jgi:hypothetical protein
MDTPPNSRLKHRIRGMQIFLPADRGTTNMTLATATIRIMEEWR